MVRRLCSGTFAVLLLMLLALAAPAGAATGFAADETLSSADASSPDVAMAPNGYAIAGWVERTSGSPVVRASVRPPGGPWSPPATFPVSLDSVFSLSVAVASSGAAAVTWGEDTSPSTFDVAVATRAAGGAFTSAEVLRGVRQIFSPSAGIAADGTVTLLYEVNPDTVVRDFPAGGSALAAAEQPLAPSCSPTFGSGIAEAPTGAAVAPLACGGASFALRVGGRWTVSPPVANDSQTCPAASTSHTAVMAAIDTAGHPVGVIATDVHQPDFSCMGGGLDSDAYSEQLALPLAGIMTPVSGTPVASGSTFGLAPSPIAGPQAAVSPAGIVFTWGATDLSFRSQAIARFFAADGSGGSAPQLVGSPVTGSLFPILALAGNGRGLLSWLQSDAGNTSIEVAVREPGTDAFGAPSPLASGRDVGPALLAMDDAGDGVAAWTQGSSPAVLHVRGFDATAPTLSGVSIPASVPIGTPATFSASPFDVWGPLTTAWSFGDGATATGATVQHAYARAGTFTASVTATDAVGNTVTSSGVVQVPGVLQPARPAISRVSLTHRRFRVGRVRTAVSARRRAVSIPLGTTFRFVLDRAASVKIAFARQASGLRSGRRCVSPSRRLRRARARRCTRLVAIRAALMRTGGAGAHAVPFSGRIGRSALAPGTYRATLTPSSGGALGAPRALSFGVVR